MKKALLTYKKGLLSRFAYKEKGFAHTERFIYIHKTKPRQIAMANSDGKWLRQIATAKRHGK